MARTNTNWNIVGRFGDAAYRINCKEHFALGETTLELARVRKRRHCKYNLNYHLVWIPKTRMQVLVRPLSDEVEATIRRVCKRNEWTLLALQVMPDHVHCFLSAPPTWSPMTIVKTLKTWTSRDLRSRYSIVRDLRDTDDFWARGYYVGCAGHVSAETVAKYIRDNNMR
jgi:putative transposase